MPARSFTVDAATAAVVEPALERLREELDVPAEFTAEELAEAAAAAVADQAAPEDATAVEFVTIDPPGAMDLDQALHLERRGDGYRIRYAIADPASFVMPGGPLDEAVHQRGMTFYGPDGRVGLHPAVLAEDAASLLPGVDRPACLWQIDLDAAGEIADASVRRALVRSRAKLTYEQVQDDLDAGRASQMLALLPVIGRLRQARERDRGGASLRIPDQEVVQYEGHYELRYRSTLDVEDWNAQISLVTGIAAAMLMRRARCGVFRTLPPADPRDVRRLRQVAHGLGIQWRRDEEYGVLLDRLDAAIPAHAAFLDEATTLFRGAGYLAFDGELPPVSVHGAIAAEYAHVTAPLRRLVDRYGLEICLAATARTQVPRWVRDGLQRIPEIMAATGRAASAYERECVNLVEAVVLRHRVGDRFDGVIVDVAPPRNGQRPGTRGTVVVADPAVRAGVRGEDLPLGEEAEVSLTDADVETRTVLFAYPAPD